MMPPHYQSLAVAGLVTVGVSWWATHALIRVLRNRGMLDRPNARSSHQVPTPRGGGLGLIAGLAAGQIVFASLGGSLPPWPILVGALFIAMVGYLDDRLGELSPILRFGAQSAVAVVVIACGYRLETLPLPAPGAIPLGMLSAPLTFVWIVGVVNIYNFLDGIDGYAGAQGVLAGISVFALGAGLAPGGTALLVSAACLGFLAHNWQPARIFMGDVGSTSLGFLLATLPLTTVPAARSLSVYATAMFLWFFLADGVYTILKRTLAGEKPWTSHRSHLYQLWVRSGLSHSAVVLRVLCLAAPLSVITLIASHRGDPTLWWACGAVAIGLFLLYRSLVMRSFHRGSEQTAG